MKLRAIKACLNNSTPMCLLMITIACVFLAEAVIMMLLSVLPAMNWWMTILIDSTMILVLVLPVLYFSQFRPLQRHLLLQKQSTESLRESEENFRTLIEYTNIIPWRFDLKKNRFTFIGKQVEKILGHPVESWTDMDSWSNRIHSDDRDRAVNNCVSSTEKGKDHDFEYRCMTKDGDIVWIQDIVTLRKDKCGVPFELVGYMVDITDRKRAEDRHRLTQSAVDQSAHPVYRVRVDGSIAYVNDAACKALGYTRNELTSMSVPQIDPDFPEDAWPTHWQKMKEAGSMTFEGHHYTKAGRVYPVELCTNHVVYHGQEYIWAYAHDISERKRAEHFQSAIFKISGSLNQTSDFKGLLKTIHETLGTLIDTTNFYIALYDAEKNSYSFPYCVDEQDEADFTPQQLKHSLTDYVRRTAKPIIVNEQTHKALIDAGAVELVGQPSPIWLGVPLRTPHGIIGVAVVQSYSDPEAYSEADLDIMSFASEHIARAIERKRAEEELRRYEYIVSNSSDMLALLDDNFVFLAANETYAKAFGKTRSDIVGYTASDVFGEIFFEKAIRPNAEKCLRGDEVHYQNWVNFPALGKRLMEVNYTSYSEDDNEIRGFVVNARDITDRTRAEQNIRDLANIVERSLNEIYIFDAETFKFIQVNRGARDNIGYTLAELTELTPFDIKPEYNKESFLKLVEPLRDGSKEIIKIETVHQRKDGSLYDVEVHLQLSEFLNKPAFVAIILDITETKRLRELESRAARLEMVGIIAGQVAHDFNNLLAPIMAYPELIHDGLPRDHKAHIYLNAIENAAKKIADINQDLLTMGRRGHYNLEVIDLNQVVLQAVQEMESRTKTISFDMHLQDKLMNIKGGAAQIHRMLTNLLVNAQDAMQNMGEVTIKTEDYYADDTSVRFGRVPRGNYVKLTISDNGSGISDDVIENILDPFFSTKTADKGRGSGLGLSVVNAVMKDHNGHLDLSSKVGQGTSFYLYFPVTREKIKRVDAEHYAVGTEKILVVDDDDIQREVSSLLLTKLGYEVSSVKSGEKAIEFLKENPQDLVILDMVMPGGIDGTETYRQILKIRSQQRAIILSGFSETDRVLEVQRLGAGAFVKKPVTQKIIAAAVRTELERQVETASS